MRDNLKSYIDLLFAGAPQTAVTAEAKAEILQNILDKYDDLIAQGQSPQDAYSQAVAGIGDVSELLTGARKAEAPGESFPWPEAQKVRARKGILRAIAVALYITCVLPPILTEGTRFGDNLGPALMFVFIAIATALMVYAGSMKAPGIQPEADDAQQEEVSSPRQELYKAINSAVWVLGLAAYFIVSFTTMAWHLTWLIFPICGVVSGLVRAIVDLVKV